MSQLRKRVASIIYSQLTLAISYRANKSRTSASFCYQQQRRWNEKKRKEKLKMTIAHKYHLFRFFVFCLTKKKNNWTACALVPAVWLIGQTIIQCAREWKIWKIYLLKSTCDRDVHDEYWVNLICSHALSAMNKDGSSNSGGGRSTSVPALKFNFIFSTLTVLIKLRHFVINWSECEF